MYVLFGFVDDGDDGAPPPFITIGIFCVLMGLVCPMLMVPVLPDMHSCRRPAAGDSAEELEDATNLISGLYTTMMNLGGVIGPAVGAVGIDKVGFVATIGMLGLGSLGLGALLLGGLVLAQAGGADGAAGSAVMVAGKPRQSTYQVVRTEDAE